MPSKKKKYNARFPAGRIKKIMQSDEEIGKVAQAVPVIISRTLELFVESLLTKTLNITISRNAKTLSTSHMKQCIMSEQRFDFLRELVKNIPDISVAEEAAAAASTAFNEDEARSSSPEEQYPDSDTPYDLSMPSTSMQAFRSAQALANGGSGGECVPQPLKSVQSQNGSGREHLKRAATSSSVIMHTTSVQSHVSSSADSSPAPKLLRSESTPVDGCGTGGGATLQHQPLHNWPPQQTTLSQSNHPHQVLRQQRFRHQHQQQQQSVPSKPQQQQLQPLTENVAPEATIVSYDFCNKPIMKIDYSQLPSAGTVPAPFSAPAKIAPNAAVHLSSSTTSAFDFSIAPVINIDLSNLTNLVAAAASNASSPSVPPTVSAASSPTVATISIGAFPTTAATSSSSPLIVTPAPSNATKATTMAAPFKSNNKSITTNIATTSATTSNNLFFELDEDYDNI